MWLSNLFTLSVPDKDYPRKMLAACPQKSTSIKHSLHFKYTCITVYTLKPVLRDHLWVKENHLNVAL